MTFYFWSEEHRLGDYHFHLQTRFGQKRFFMRIKDRIYGLLPPGFHVKQYSENNFGIIDERGRQHMHMRYTQRRFPHNFHLDFKRPEFRETFDRIVKECFPKADMVWAPGEDLPCKPPG